MPGPIDRAQAALAAFRDKAQPMDAGLKDLGLRMKIDQWHAARISLISSMTPYIKDRRIDIADRVEYVDDLITNVCVPWGRGRSDPIWTRLYNDWQAILGLWRQFESQRSFVEAQVFAEVTELAYVYSEKIVDGVMKVDMERRWTNPRTIRAESFLAKMEADRVMGGEPTVKLIGLWKVPLMQDPTFTNDLLFVKENVQEIVRMFGDSEMITRGFKMVNLGFHEKDVTVQNVNVFHLTSAQSAQQWAQPVVPTSSFSSPQQQPASQAGQMAASKGTPQKPSAEPAASIQVS
jgi:hypothetical protein